MKSINLTLLLISFSILNILGQSNVYMDGTPFDLNKEAKALQKLGHNSYTIHYLDYIGSTIEHNKPIEVYNKMHLHQDQCHQAAIDTGIDKDKPFGMNALDVLDFNTDKPLFINFAFGACPPCLREIPIINELYQTHKNDFKFIVITPDKDSSKLRSEFHEDIEIISMSDMDITFQFLINYYPATYITNDKQEIQWCLKEIKDDFIGSYIYKLIF